MHQVSKTIINAIGISCIICTFYLLSFNGIPNGSDEELYASAARNFALNGALSAGQLYGNLRLEGNYHGVEPAFSMLASFWYRFMIQFPVGRLQGFYLLPIFCISIAAGVIIILADQLGFSHSTGIVSGILFGVGTIAWPYTKYFFREALLVLFFVLCILCFEMMFKKHLKGGIFFLWFALFVVLLILSVLTKIMAIFLIPAFFIMFLVRKIRDHQWNLKFWLLCSASILAFFVLGIYLLVQKATDANAFYRYTGSFLADAIARYREISHDHFMEAILAPLISPWKGIFIYSPPCLLAILAVIQKNNRNAIYLFILPLVATLGFLIVQALAYDDEWWSATWSSRFLLPVIPLFIIAALPWVETTLHAKKLSRYIALLIVSMLGMLIQVGAVVFHEFSYDLLLFDELQQDFPDKVVWNFSKMPVFGQWKLAFNGTEPALLFWRVFTAQPIMVMVIVFVGFVFVVGILYILKQNSKNELANHNAYLFLFTSLAIQISLIALVFNLSVYDPFYFSSHLGDLKKICIQLNQLEKPADAVVVKPYSGDTWYYFMNNDCAKAEWFSLPFGSQMASSLRTKALAYDLLTKKLIDSKRIWLVNQTWDSNEDMTDRIFSDSGFYVVSQQRYTLDDSKIIFSLYSRKSK